MVLERASESSSDGHGVGRGEGGVKESEGWCSCKGREGWLRWKAEQTRSLNSWTEKGAGRALEGSGAIGRRAREESGRAGYMGGGGVATEGAAKVVVEERDRTLPVPCAGLSGRERRAARATANSSQETRPGRATADPE